MTEIKKRILIGCVAFALGVAVGATSWIAHGLFSATEKAAGLMTNEKVISDMKQVRFCTTKAMNTYSEVLTIKDFMKIVGEECGVEMECGFTVPVGADER